MPSELPRQTSGDEREYPPGTFVDAMRTDQPIMTNEPEGHQGSGAELPQIRAALRALIQWCEERERFTRQALRRYGSHDARCTILLDDYHEGEPLGCSCGYEEALNG
jgi:hypothetical protein